MYPGSVDGIDGGNILLNYFENIYRFFVVAKLEAVSIGSEPIDPPLEITATTSMKQEFDKSLLGFV